MSSYSLSLRALSYSLLTLFLCWESAMALLAPISLILVYMTLLTILISLPFVESKAMLLLVEGASVICVLFFLSASSFLSWLSFELSSLPIFFLILLWGKQKEKNQALLLYLVYSAVAASVFLFSFLFLDGAPSSTSSFLMVLPFLIKLPCFFLHLWLIMAHVEAPTVGSIILASVLLKLGSFGLFRCLVVPSVVLVLSVLGLLFMAYLLSSLNNLKLLVAYSSILTMAYFLLGLFIGNSKGEFSSYLSQFTHGVSSSLLFMLAGWLQNSKATLNLLWLSFPNNLWINFLFLYNSGTYVGVLFLSELLLFGSSQAVYVYFFMVAILGSLSYNLLVPLLLSKKETTPSNFLPLGLWSLFVLNNFFLLLL